MNYCKVCHAKIDIRMGRVKTCCHEHSKICDAFHNDFEKARDFYLRQKAQDDAVNSFIYAKRPDYGSVDC